MEAVPRNNSVTDEDLERIYSNCIDFLKERVSYLWKGRSNPKEYSLGTWSNKVSYSAIKKFGSNSDKAYLLEPSNRNKDKRNAGRKRTRSTSIKHPTRQERRARNQHRDATVQNEEPGNGGNTEFATAFAHLGELTEANEQRLEEIRQEVAMEDQQARRADEARQIREEGWASRPIPTLRNYGNMAAFDRQQIGQKIGEIYPESLEATGTTQATSNHPGRDIGRCCITGCAFPSMQLLHRCAICKRFIHMPCAEPFSNLAEDDRNCDRCVTKR
jgi:hypothetical protein